MPIKTAPGTMLVNKICPVKSLVGKMDRLQVTGGVEKSPYALINTAE
jgi:hypothetical protein